MLERSHGIQQPSDNEERAVRQHERQQKEEARAAQSYGSAPMTPQSTQPRRSTLSIRL